jgi:cob(I)alamin adenosyltransferase
MGGSIATKRGDGGTGQLMYGPRVSKASARLEAVGTIDELGSFLGLARATAAADEVAPRVAALQRELFLLGCELATPPSERGRLKTRLQPEHLAGVEAQVAEIEALEGLLDDWALPGATAVGAALDVARAVCRRAERRVQALYESGEEDHPLLRPYLNRLSDLLWLYGRWYELRHGVSGALRSKSGGNFRGAFPPPASPE